jgi:vacuolar-type H+-ATPase subunit I/STV1
MPALNKPESRKVREMSFSNSQRLNADQPPKKVAFTRIIALVAMISGLLNLLLSFVLSFIFDIDLLAIPDGFVLIALAAAAALVGVALGLLSLILGSKDTKTRLLAVIGLLTGVVWFIVAVGIFFAIREIPLWRG